MENGIPALVIAAIIMTASLLVTRSGLTSMDAIGATLKESEVRMSQRAHTQLSVTSTSIDGTGANITVTVKNDGTTSLGDFARMDVIVNYFGETGTRYDKWLGYTSGALQSDTWTTGTFTDDVFEPHILNPGESMELLLRVNPVVGRGTSNRAVIVTEQGVTADALFAGPP